MSGLGCGAGNLRVRVDGRQANVTTLTHFEPGKPRSLARFQRIAAYLKARRRRPSEAPHARRRSYQAQLRQKFCEQLGTCVYCQRDAWLPIHENATVEELRADRRRDKRMRATREHLVRVTDGGSDNDENIVMACAECNHKRGNKSAAEWRANRQVLGERLGSENPK